jgi:hypothetical protein
MAFLYVTVAILVSIFLISLIASSISVWIANRNFFKELTLRGYDEEEAKTIMNRENVEFQSRVKTGERVLNLAQHLREVLHNY